MTALFSLAWQSAWNRRFTLSLTIFSIALSTFMLLGVERIRADVRDGFTSAVSGTDLIIGARSGSVQLLLYSVFHLGAATNNVRWHSIQDIEKMAGVTWVIPLSLGDSHHGFPVLGTSTNFFEHFKYGNHQSINVSKGNRFEDLFDAVIGADVARQLGYKVGDQITLTHGAGGAINAVEHDDKPFVISGILAATGTPIDRTVHISLEAMEALHVDWSHGVQIPGRNVSAEAVRSYDLTPKNVTAALVGLKSRAQVFSVQRAVNNYRSEPLMAVLPGVTMDELWRVIGTAEKSLLLMSVLVAFVSLLGMIAVVLAGLNERRRELAVLRAVGARPTHIIWLLSLEGALTTFCGVVAGSAVLAFAGLISAPFLLNRFGVVVNIASITETQWWVVAGLLLTGFLASLIPAWRAYKLSLSDGLSPPV